MRSHALTPTKVRGPVPASAAGRAFCFHPRRSGDAVTDGHGSKLSNRQSIDAPRAVGVSYRP